MKPLLLLPLIPLLCAGAVSAQTFYSEQVLFPAGAYGSAQPHASPITQDLSALVSPDLPAGSATVTFASHPAPYVRVDALSRGRNVVLNAQLRYEFSYAGPALSYVPIHFVGLFDIQHGLALFNRSEVEFSLSATSLDFQRQQSVGVAIDCSSICRYMAAPAATSLSSIQAPFAGTAAASLLGFSAATGSFSGVLMAGTDANGQGRGVVSLRAFASNAVSGYAPSWAFIDPALTIDAAYLADHPGASLSLPTGVGNAITAVPEPQSLALLLAGLAGLGGLAARRQRAAGRRVSR